MKSTNINFRTMYETVYEGIDATWNMGWKKNPLIQDVMDIIKNNDATPAHIESSNISDWKNIAFFEEIFKFFHSKRGKKWWKNEVDWSTEAVGSFFIKNLKHIKNEKPKCWEIIKPLINDIFKIPKQNISLPDIAILYTAIDFRVIDTEGHLEDSPQLNNSLKACFKDVQANSFGIKETVEMYFTETIGNSAKYMEPSPCLNLTKFHKCNHYCDWHKNFFDVTPKKEFLTIMQYALPQKKN